MSNIVKLLDYQGEHFNRIESILSKYSSYYDTSDMGRGKTYITLKLAQKYNLSIVIICPSSVIAKWNKLAKHFGINIVISMTYHALRGTNVNPPKHKLLTRNNNKFTTTDLYKAWVRHGILLIFDEAQNCKNPTSQRSAAHALVREIAQMQNTRSKVGLLSGTPCDKHEHVVSIMMMLGVIVDHDTLFVYDNRKYESKGILEVIQFSNELDYDKSVALHSSVIINRKTAHRLCYQLYHTIIKDYMASSLPPKSNIDVKNGYYIMDESNIIELANGINKLSMATRFNPRTCTIHLGGMEGAIMNALKAIETAKLQTMIRLAKNVLNTIPNSKVVLYVTYIISIHTLEAKLKEFNPLIMYGKHKRETRINITESFQMLSNDRRLLITNPQVGGVGIDLDDQDGNWPRYGFGIPTHRPIDSVQAIKRFDRANTKSMASFRWIYSKEYRRETSILNALARKTEVLKNVVSNSNGILFPGDYENDVEGDDIIEPDAILSDDNIIVGGISSSKSVTLKTIKSKSLDVISLDDLMNAL